MLAPRRKTAPAAALLTLDEVKAQARIDFGDDDALLTRLIAAATSLLDGWSGILGRCLINQVWVQDFEGWSTTFRLPFPNVSAVVIKYRDANDAEQTLASSNYEVVDDLGGSLVIFKSTFVAPDLSTVRAAPVSVELTAGYGAAASDVPDMIRHAALMQIAYWFEHREAMGEASSYAVSILAPFRRVDL